MTGPEISLRISMCNWDGRFARWPLCFETLFQSKTRSGLLGGWGLFNVRSAVQEHPNRDRRGVLASLRPELRPQLATATSDQPQVQGRLEPTVCYLRLVQRPWKTAPRNALQNPTTVFTKNIFYRTLNNLPKTYKSHIYQDTSVK